MQVGRSSGRIFTNHSDRRLAEPTQERAGTKRLLRGPTQVPTRKTGGGSATAQEMEKALPGPLSSRGKILKATVEVWAQTYPPPTPLHW